MNGEPDSELALGQAGVQALQERVEEDETIKEKGKREVIDRMAVMVAMAVLVEVVLVLGVLSLEEPVLAEQALVEVVKEVPVEQV